MTNRLYHISTSDFRTIHISNQGFHLAPTIKAGMSVIENRPKQRKIFPRYLYIYDVIKPLKILSIDFDTMNWIASNIAEILLNKYYGRFSEGAYGRVNDDEDNYSEEIPSSAINIDSTTFTKEDLNFLHSIALKGQQATESDFLKIAKFLESQNYDCIKYPLAERGNREVSYIIWDSNLIKLKKVFEIPTQEDCNEIVDNEKQFIKNIFK